MKSTSTLLIAFVLFTLRLYGDGSLTYQNQCGDKDKSFYGIDPNQPTQPMYGGLRSDYANRPLLEGSGYWAELWYAPGVEKAEDDLAPVPGSRVEFRTGGTAGLIKGIAKLTIPGTLAGDHVTLQVRVWDNRGGTIQSWAEAAWVARGASTVISDFELGGVDSNGMPVLGDGNLCHRLHYLGLAIIPEPNVWKLGLLGLAAFIKKRHL